MYTIESIVFVNYIDEILEVIEAHGWVFIITEMGKRKAAILPYANYWNSLDDGK